MHMMPSNKYVTDLANKICQEKDLEDLFLDYLRVLSSEKQLGGFFISKKNKDSLALYKQIALDAFLVAANERYSIQHLNGEVQELIEQMTIKVTNKYRLEEYFEL